MKYCVYLHRRKDNGKIFYIGMGNSKRPYTKQKSKTNDWNLINNISGHSVQIVEDNLTKDLAIELEEFLLDFIPDLVNVHKTSCVTKELPDNISDYVYYDESSPTCLRWKDEYIVKRRNNNNNIAGTKSKNYYVVCINYNKYPVHRVVMKLHGLTSEDTCDHIDNNPLNNKIENLRFVSQRENNRNKKCHNGIPRKNNISGVTGVSETKIKNKSGKFTYYAIVQWVDKEGKHKNKTFSYLKYGIVEAFALACEFRNKINSLEFN